MKTAKLLVVENDSLLVRLLPLQLTRRGFEVVAIVRTGEEAIIKAAEHPIHLVLMDIDLDGELDGIAAAAQIRAAKNLPIIFTTSHTDTEVMRRVQSMGDFTCLVKPFTEKELLMAIEFNLYRQQAEREQARLREELRQLAEKLRIAETGGS